ncbi:MAG: hypothetical protein J1E57_00630 [Prevotella sp.]|nr:hypothetical protein [Prevotella sp.]
MKVVICLEKFSDWLEAYSIFQYYTSIKEVKILFLEDHRNNMYSVRKLFQEYQREYPFYYEGHKIKSEFIDAIGDTISIMKKGDVLAAPFVRYRSIWKYVRLARTKKIQTVHLSESLPDSFGPIGYRFGFKIKKINLKQLLAIPAMYLYAITHKPDLCFYNMGEYIKNPFCRKTIKAYIPSIAKEKSDFLHKITGGQKRPLLISGFEYDHKKMANALNIKQYIATSKLNKIIIDGQQIPLDFFICAEEVLLSGYSDSIIGYNTTAMCWAKLVGNMKITCYESKKLSFLTGFMYGILSRRTLKKCGITLLPQCAEMVVKY